MSRQPKGTVSRVLQLGVLLVAAQLAVACASTGSSARQADNDREAGFAAAKRGYWQEALLRFQTADRRQPGQPQILNNLAVALEAVGRYEEARTTYQRALELAPGNRNIDRNYKRFEEFFEAYVAQPEQPDDSPEQPQEAEESTP